MPPTSSCLCIVFYKLHQLWYPGSLWINSYNVWGIFLTLFPQFPSDVTSKHIASNCPFPNILIMWTYSYLCSLNISSLFFRFILILLCLFFRPLLLLLGMFVTVALRCLWLLPKLQESPKGFQGLHGVYQVGEAKPQNIGESWNPGFPGSTCIHYNLFFPTFFGLNLLFFQYSKMET